MSPISDPKRFLESTPLLPIEMDSAGRVLYVGPQAEELLGVPGEEWSDSDFWSNHVPPDDHSTMWAARRNTAETRGRHEVDYRMERGDGRVVWVAEMLGFADTKGGPVLRGFLWDVTGRKRQELALWKKEERLRAMIRKAPDALILTDAAGAVVNINDQAEALFQYSLSDIVGSSLEHLLPDALQPRLAQLRAAFERDPQRRSIVEGEPFAIQRPDGSEIPVELSLSRVSAGEEESRLLWAARDLTVRRRMESHKRGS